VKALLVIEVKKGVEINDVMADMEYNFISQTDGAKVIDTEIVEQEVINLKSL
jgi:acyl CoA:acetate/3-ketoacid CoA transferase